MWVMIANILFYLKSTCTNNNLKVLSSAKFQNNMGEGGGGYTF